MPTKLEQMQLQFRQRLMQEKEDRMIKIHTDSQQKALNKVLRYNDSATTTSPTSSANSISAVRKPVTMAHPQAHQTSPAKRSSPGVDRSRPLPPINRNGYSNVRNGVSHVSGESSSTSSSSSWTSSTKVTPVHNGVRSKSVDVEGANRYALKPSVKAKHVADTISHHRDGGTLMGHQHGPYHHNANSIPDGKPPPSEGAKPKQDPQNRNKAKTGYETSSSKLSNGHTTASFKSSVEQRTMAGSSNSKSVPHSSTSSFSTSTSRRTNKQPSTTTTAAYAPRKVVNGGSSSESKVTTRNTAASKVAPVKKPPNPNQEQCRFCGRNFNKDRIEKHSSICSKTKLKKVKVFDATKMRVKGTEAETFVRKGLRQEPPKAKKTNWKKQHEDFINTIRQAKIAQRHLAAGGKLSDLPPPPPSDTSSYIPCPYCGRKFDEGVAQRHIPKCKNIVSNKKAPIKKK